MSTTTELKIRAGSTGKLGTYRHDIDGLRAIAILLVVVYHVWIGRVSGGVDAFLMISAFFFTGSFVRRLEAGKPLAVVGQWTRTFKRLLPPAAVVLLATLIAGLVILPNNRLIELFRHTWASLFYVENWRLGIDAIDYYANKVDASPVQHFWSLSVQGQVFLLWPLLFLIVRFFVNRFAFNVRRVSTVVLAIVFVVSFVYSVVTTITRQEFAYFDTGARLWEFAAGSLLAVLLPWVKIPSWLRSLLGWVGILALLSCGLVIDVQGGFPGYLALWPILSVAAIVLAGTGDGAEGPITRVLRWKPLVKLGHDAYGLYLVHWPILVYTLVLKRGAPLTFWEGLVIVLASLVLARLVTWLVDDRIRYAKWANVSKFRGLLVILLSIVLVAAPTGYFHWQTNQAIEQERQAIASLDAEASHPGADVFLDGWQGDLDVGVPPIPLAGDLESEWGALPKGCNDQFAIPFDELGAGCTYLPADNQTLTVAVIGDSHAEQWLAPIETIAKQEGWQVYAFLKGGCSLSGATAEEYEADNRGTECVSWMSAVLPQIDELNPDIVLTVGSRTFGTNEQDPVDIGSDEKVPFGLEQAIEYFTGTGTPIVLLRDNPRFTFNPYECAATAIEFGIGAADQYGANADCGVARSRALAPSNPADRLVQPGVTSVDMSDFICAEKSCPAIIGNVFVYLDDNHLTTTYTKTMAPMLKPRLLEAIDRARSWK